MRPPPSIEAALDSAQRPPITVFVISDVRFYREGLARILASTDGVEVLGTATGTDEGVQLAARLAPDVVLLDTAMADGVSAAQQLAGATPSSKIVALAVPPAEQELINLFEAGVLGYVTREQSLDEVVATITSVAQEEMVSSPATRTLVAQRVRALATELRPREHSRLTARELEILDLVGDGLSNKEIARELAIELATVKNHVHNILEKLQVRSRSAAAAEARLWTRPQRATQSRLASASA